MNKNFIVLSNGIINMDKVVYVETSIDEDYNEFLLIFTYEADELEVSYPSLEELKEDYQKLAFELGSR